eukprot:6532461-Pyramimonas_sp.AAC.1
MGPAIERLIIRQRLSGWSQSQPAQGRYRTDDRHICICPTSQLKRMHHAQDGGPPSCGGCVDPPDPPAYTS